VSSLDDAGYDCALPFSLASTLTIQRNFSVSGVMRHDLLRSVRGERAPPALNVSIGRIVSSSVKPRDQPGKMRRGAGSGADLALTGELFQNRSVA
jgi:hypothetical protein